MKHAFYVNLSVLKPWLEFGHSESEGENPLEVICKKCDRNFSFTHESFKELIGEIKQTE